MTNDFRHGKIEDNEKLYRRVPIHKENTHPNERKYYYDISGVLKVTPYAFLDRDRQPSIDRACNRNLDPTETQQYDTDGIILLIAGDIRNKVNIDSHDVCVEYKPVYGNIAHSLILLKPHPDTRNKREKFREDLADIANMRGWEMGPLVPPTDVAHDRRM